MPEIRNAEDRGRARAAFTTFAQVYGAWLPRAVKDVTDGQGQLVAFWDVPAVLWDPLRTTAPMESSAFLTVGLRAVVEVEGRPPLLHCRAGMGFKDVQARGVHPVAGRMLHGVGRQADVRFLPFRVPCGSIKHACGTGP
ncbi:hypothetical protein ACWGLP_29015 [Streptomyces lydicus]